MGLMNKESEYFRVTGITYKVDEKILVIEIQSWKDYESRLRGETKYEKPVFSSVTIFVDEKQNNLLQYCYEKIKNIPDFKDFKDV